MMIEEPQQPEKQFEDSKEESKYQTLTLGILNNIRARAFPT
jgi:hypothetical protein